MRTELRLRYRIAGAHVHCRLFVGPTVASLGLAGALTFSLEEWPAVRERFSLGAGVTILPEDPAWTTPAT